MKISTNKKTRAINITANSKKDSKKLTNFVMALGKAKEPNNER